MKQWFDLLRLRFYETPLSLEPMDEPANHNNPTLHPGPVAVHCLAGLGSRLHENCLHSTLASSHPHRFTLVLGMLITACPIVTQSSFPRSYQSLPLAP
ncbi:unnamed protein product [Protopolystoma xenopodis]|uniref:Uncharacterized protein n=1 Tax=Protopolystoma xenopodis TaxID=117903 RepID=A0A448WJK7_9PLAT|nr:unnamed protein product [Protopolystoma xenopodis]